MPATPTPRLKLPLPGEDDPADIPSDLTKLATPLDTSAVIFGQTVSKASRPAAGTPGRIYAHQPGQKVGWAGQAVAYDNGAAWSHMGSSCPVLTQPAASVLGTASLPPNSEVDPGQLIMLNLPAQAGGGAWQPAGQDAASWFFQYQADGYWYAVSDQPSVSRFDFGSFCNLGALASGAWYSLGAGAPRTVTPIPGAYALELELGMIYTGGIGSIEVHFWWSDWSANTGYQYAGSGGSGAQAAIGQPNNLKARTVPMSMVNGYGYVEHRLWPTVNGAVIGWRRASMALHPIWLPGNAT